MDEQFSSKAIRNQFFDFFRSKEHTIVPSAPIVLKDDPTLLFTNAGMNQFKDFFLGNKTAPYKRVADTQKCLRVSGKHNDLEEVGVDTYHHTMFEMLGNWSFGDYFKKEAIEWSWELLTDIYKLDKEQLYITVFEGDEKEGIPKDETAYNEWRKYLPEARILPGNKKDNFWEMGDAGPCGPCTEIHVDCRTDEERKLVDGSTLVNQDHPQVIEIWNNVFIQYNRKKDGSLEALPSQHVDTGMGLERLVRVLQKKQSNYDTDIFSETIAETGRIVNKKYTGNDDKESIAFRVIADHIRAIAFTIADGQLPSNTGAGYVIRRILRRAVRYYYTYLDYKQPLLFQLLPVIAKQFDSVFPEVEQQLDFLSNVVKEEEDTFLRTLDKGLNRIEQIKRTAIEHILLRALRENNYQFENKTTNKNLSLVDVYLPEFNAGIDIVSNVSKGYIPSTKQEGLTIHQFYISKDENISAGKIIHFLENIVGKELKYDYDKGVVIDGAVAFELFDTYGFPLDLTKLIARENDLIVDETGFEQAMQQQKNRSRSAALLDTEDWVSLTDNRTNTFVGYDSLEAQSNLTRYRKVSSKSKEFFQLILDITPFYAESGGQVGDTGTLQFGDEIINVTNTKKENDLIIHFTDKLPADITTTAQAKVNSQRRKAITLHHSVTHLMHAALRNILGKHVAQKGSLVNDEHLRFDFSHFAKLTDKEIAAVEKMVNEKIRENIPVVIQYKNKEEAISMGAMALFGEKYGDVVRVVIIDPAYSLELCGGTHVGSTGELGIFIIKHESAIAAGVRRIEAVCGSAALQYIDDAFAELNNIRELLKNSKDLSRSVQNLLTENTALSKRIEGLEARQLVGIRNELLQKDEIINNVTFVGEIIEVSNGDALKKLCVDLKNHLHDHVVVLCSNIDGKAFVALGISDTVVAAKNLDATRIIKEYIAPLIKGGGGGQKNLATAGGQDISNLKGVIEKIKTLLS